MKGLKSRTRRENERSERMERSERKRALTTTKLTRETALSEISHQYIIPIRLMMIIMMVNAMMVAE